MSDRALEKRLREIPIEDEAGAEERGWRVVSAAHAERAPIRPSYPVRRLALVLAASLAILALALSPAGAEVVDAVEEVIGVSEDDARPALRSLPAAGEILVESESGPWVVREDGSKRLLGDYAEATWSPRGLFVAAADGRQLVAVDPLGNVRWTVTAPGVVRDPRWSPSGVRIAYRSGDDLRVVAGDGTGDHLVARDVAPVAPAWRPVEATKLQPVSGAPGTNQLAYADTDGRLHLVDVDGAVGEDRLPAMPRRRTRSLRALAFAPAGERVLTMTSRAIVVESLRHGRGEPRFEYRAPARAELAAAAMAPSGERVAAIVRERDRSRLIFLHTPIGAESARPNVVFAGPGQLADPTWAPDGRWLLASWRSADQWLFLRSERPRRLIAIDDISRQFDPGGDGAGFPTVDGWILPQR